MAKKLKVYYANVPNMGDLLNRDIISKCFGYEVIRTTYLTGQISAIGSGLGNYTYEEEVWKNILKGVTAPFFSRVYIWGTGFVGYKEKDTRFYKKDMRFCAVRGELSKRRVEKIVGYGLDIPTGDAGILASNLLKEKIKKKYAIGIIAHYKEQKDVRFERLHQKYDNAIIINVMDQPMNVIRKISECECILSSSLHGLIIADSLGIPNRHIVVTDNLLGDGFKFDDYYSAYGLKHEYTDLNSEEPPSIKEIYTSYKISSDDVEKKKKELLESFPLKG